MSENEKKLLNAIGTFPEISVKELFTYTSYKWTGTVLRKLNQFKKQYLTWGPIYDIDYGKLCRNPLCLLYCVLELAQDYELAISFLRLIEPLRWVFPVLSPHKELLNVGFLSSHTTKMKGLLKLLKDSGIITDYIVRVSHCRVMMENPNFFGDFNPPLNHLLDPCELPHMSLGCHDTDWNECDLRILPYLQTGFKGAKLIEILREERKLNRTWTYEQVKYSREKMIRNGLIEKKYSVFPFPPHQCASFILFLETEDTALTHTILHNFAKGGQVHKKYTLCEDWGLIACVSHPQFLTELMYNLDKVDEITKKELYQLRSFPPGKYYFDQPIELRYYNFDKQTLEYPYHLYREKIKENLELK